MVELDNSPSMKVSLAPAETNSVISSHNQTPSPITTAKPKRKLPGMPDPDAVVIALSPRTLLATNRFVCEVCNKGFQRDQNLQLHRRGHNLPWKLRQRISGEEIRKRVYLCPEPNCVHHNPARALGDLTGVKKHFCRKHGEKKWRCERCSKKYAVQSDWKAHMKTCGTKEYRCDCGTLFSRRDSFITHRAFCDALADESVRYQASLATTSSSQAAAAAFKPPIAAPKTSSRSPPPPLTSSTGVISPDLSVQSSENKQTACLQQQPIATVSLSSSTTNPCSSLSTCSSNVSSSSGVFSSMVSSSLAGLTTKSSSSHSPSSYSELICAIADSERTTVEPMSLSLSSSLRASNNTSSSLFPATEQDHHKHFLQQPSLSATALLQKAAQLGATSSTYSFLHGLGLSVSSSSGNQDVNGISPTNKAAATSTIWMGNVKQGEGNSISCGLGQSSDGGSNITGMIMDPSSIFGNTHTTLDLLGLGVGNSGAAPSSRLSASLTTVRLGGGFDVSAASFGGGVGSEGQTWESSAENRPSPL